MEGLCAACSTYLINIPEKCVNAFDHKAVNALTRPSGGCFLLGDIDVNIHNELGHTVLLRASCVGHHACVQALIKTGASVNKVPGSESSALVSVAWAGERKTLKLLVNAGADVNETDGHGDTALMWAVKKGNLDCAKLIMQEGADVNRTTTEAGRTALMMAASAGHEECLRLLLKQEADVNAVDHSWLNASALAHAAWQNHDKCVNILIEAGADVNKGNSLLLSCKKGHLKCVTRLLEAGADVNAGEDCYTAMFEAVEGEHIETVKALLRAGAHINRRSVFGYNALQHYIAQHVTRRKDMLMLLVAAGESLDGSTSGRNTTPGGGTGEKSFTRLYNESICFPEQSPTDVLSLHDHCRKSIRQRLLVVDSHTHLFYRIPRLGLPKSLTSFLLYDVEIDEEVSNI